MNIPIVRTYRQKRTIIALVKHGKVSVKMMRDMAGVLNVPELMAGLRRNGWKWHCELIDVLDRDGKKCRPGEYSLQPESLEIAAGMVKEWEAATSHTQPESSTVQSTQP